MQHSIKQVSICPSPLSSGQMDSRIFMNIKKNLSLKALAFKVLGMDNLLDNLWTMDLMMIFEERAAILEFDAGFSRQDAERMAYEEVVNYVRQ